MDDILAKKNRHLFLEEKDNQNNSFIGNINDVANRKEELDTVATHIESVDTVGNHIDNVDTVAANISDINDAVDNIATVKTFNDNVNNGTMQYLLEAFTTSLNDQGNAWEVRLTQLGESILATTSAFNYSTVVTVSSDIPANGTLILPNSMKYKVGTHMLMVSWNGTVCYAGEQYDEVGAYGVWATSIKLNQPAKAGDKIQLRIVALTDQSSYVDITEAAVTASQFIASGANTERYLSEYFGDIVNVKNFGAVGNGVNDDTTAFQSAIASGKAVFVPEGTYKLSTDLNGVFCGVGNSVFTGGTVNGSTILRGIAQRNSDIINVKDFGAKGDGVTDDTEAFESAVEAANGKEVFVPQGNYDITGITNGKFVSDGLVNAGNVRVESIFGNHKDFELLKAALSFSNPSQKIEIQNYLGRRQTGIYFQSICYDSKRERFVLGAAVSADNTQDGKIYALEDLNDESTVAVSADIAGGHFNDLSYDAKNDVIYLAPGSTPYSNKLLVLNPATLAIAEQWTCNGTAWECSVCGDYVYVVEYANGASTLVRYSTQTKQKDASFGEIAVVAPTVADGESIVGQGSFVYNDIFVLMYCVTQSALSTLSRTVYKCYDLNTRRSLSVSFATPTGEEPECADVKNNVLYMIAPSSNKMVVYINPLETIFTSGRYRKAVALNGDLNDYLAEGEYVIKSSTEYATFANIPAGNYQASCGLLKVEDTCLTGQKMQTIILKTGVFFRRFINVESGIFSTWHIPGYFTPRTSNSSLSLDSFVQPGAMYVTDVQNLPSGVNGWVVTYGANSASQETLMLRQFFLRHGTAGSSDYPIFFRTGSFTVATQESSWGTWTQIITSKDRFPADFAPGTNNTYTLGTSSYKWKQLYANTSTINTSDERLKTKVADLDEKLFRAWGRVGYKVFQFKDAVEKKGENARLHVGVIAQKVQEAFVSEGLDANRYGLFCYDEWPDKYDEDVIIDEEAVLDEEGHEIKPAKTHVERKLVQKAGNAYGIRYEEALALECAYQRWLGEQKDAKIEALMQRISALENNQ